jgi:hypothetical protein
MSGRIIGGQSLYGTAVYSAAPTFGATYSEPAQLLTDLAARLLDDPLSTDGVSVGPHAVGQLRLVVQALNPTSATDSVYGTSVYGTGLYSVGVGNWMDITSRVRGVTWNNGQPAPNKKMQVGVATLDLDNRDGLLSPWATSGPFVGNTTRSWMRAGLIIRWGVILVNGAGWTLPGLDFFSAFFTGKVETIVEKTSQWVDAWNTLTLTETTADLGAVSPNDQATSSTRPLSSTILEALIASGWKYQTSLQVPKEDTFVGETTLSGGTSAARIDLLTDGMHWDFCANGRGQLEVVARHGADNEHTIQACILSSVPSVGELPIVDVTTYSNIERVVNQIEAARVNAGVGDVVDEEDDRSMQQFGIISTGYGFPRSDLVLVDDTAVAFLLSRVIALRAWDDLGFDTVTLDADQDPVNMPAILTFIACRGRDGVLAMVEYQHPSGKLLQEVVAFESQTHSIVPEGGQMKWTCVLHTGHSGVATPS